jgi:hypothetical protein
MMLVNKIAAHFLTYSSKQIRIRCDIKNYCEQQFLKVLLKFLKEHDTNT